MEEKVEESENEYKNNDVALISLSTYPDIIVHKRSKNHPTNILVIEMKKANADEDDVRFDHEKLKAFTSDGDCNPYKYKLGVHLKVGYASGEVFSDSTYFQNGRSE